jgi:hypothetical protein
MIAMIVAIRLMTIMIASVVVEIHHVMVIVANFPVDAATFVKVVVTLGEWMKKIGKKKE